MPMRLKTAAEIEAAGYCPGALPEPFADESLDSDGFDRWMADTALTPLAAIADAYEANELDEARPERNQGLEHDLKTVLVSGRGGKTLLTLADAFKAREVLRGL